jgi:hypothetical protein
MEIVLKPKQLQILGTISAQKKALENEFGKLIQRENEIVTVICEDAGVTAVDGMYVNDGKLIIPEVMGKAVPDSETKSAKKLQKVK